MNDHPSTNHPSCEESEDEPWDPRTTLLHNGNDINNRNNSTSNNTNTHISNNISIYDDNTNDNKESEDEPSERTETYLSLSL